MPTAKDSVSKVSQETPVKKKKKSKTKLSLEQIAGLALVLLVIIGLAVGLYLSFQTQQTGSKAAAGNATLSIVPQNQTLSLDESGSASVFINPNGEQVLSVLLKLTYDPSVITVNDIRPGNFFTSQASQIGDPLVIVKNISTPGSITYALSFPLRQSPNDPINYSTSAGDVAVIDFTMVGSGSTNIDFVVDQPGSTDVNDIDANKVLASVTSGQISTATTSTNTRLYISNPSSTNVRVGDTVSYQIMFDTDGQDIVGVDAVMNIPSDLFDVVSIDGGSNFSDYPETSYEPSTNTLILSGTTGTNPITVVNGNGIQLGTITLQAKASGTANLDFIYSQGDRNDSNMVTIPQAGQDPVDILAQVSGMQVVIQDALPGATATPTPTPTVTPTATPTPTPTSDPSGPSGGAEVNLDVKIGFQGKARAEANRTMDVTVTFLDLNSQETQVRQGNTTSDGTLSTTMNSGDYIMLVEAPGYLSRVYGTINDPVAIPSGVDVTIDIAVTPLLGGDFNNDGEINEVDYTLYFLQRFKTADDLVDLDESGEVNNLDFAIIRSNWGLQAQELPAAN